MNKINLHEMFKARMNEFIISQTTKDPEAWGCDIRTGYTAALNDLQGKVDGLLKALEGSIEVIEQLKGIQPMYIVNKYDAAKNAIAEFKNGVGK